MCGYDNYINDLPEENETRWEREERLAQERHEEDERYSEEKARQQLLQAVKEFAYARDRYTKIREQLNTARTKTPRIFTRRKCA